MQKPLILSIHHDLGTLIEAHVCITEQAPRKVRQGFVVGDSVEHLAAFLSYPLHEVPALHHCWDVVAMLFSFGWERIISKGVRGRREEGNGEGKKGREGDIDQVRMYRKGGREIWTELGWYR